MSALLAIIVGSALMKTKLITIIAAALIGCCFVNAKETSVEKQELPLGFKQAEFVATIQSVTVVDAESNLQYWRLKVDSLPAASYVFTDKNGKVGERVIVRIVIRVGTNRTWTSVRHLKD